MLNLTSENNGYKAGIHLIMLISYSCPNLDNIHFLNYIEIFTNNAIKSKNTHFYHLIYFYKALKNLKYFKNDKTV